MFGLFKKKKSKKQKHEEESTLVKVVANEERDECAKLVCRMPWDSSATSVAAKIGLSITTLSWEDNARTKGACWGPCISDMTLVVNGFAMPLIKTTSNFVDETWDVEIEKIPLVVGNEDGTALRTVTLKEYLKDFRSFLNKPSSWPGTRTSLLKGDENDNDSDKHVICSAQACFLPMPKEGDAKFNVAIRNHQSEPSRPAVLAIVASSNGTSAQILDGSRQLLYHNKNGERASFIGQRLSDFRAESSSSQSPDAPMTESEQQQNMLTIIQVPLKHRNYNRCPPNPMMAPPGMCFSPVPSAPLVVDVEAAIIKIGESEGAYDEIHGCEIERDPKFPVRVTMQYYKATSNGAVNDAVMSDIASELQGARKWAVAISSLVTETTNRTTEHSMSPYPPPPPPPVW